MSRVNPLYLSFAGLIVTLVGVSISAGTLQQFLFLLGAISLLVASYLEKHQLFYYLEVMVVACILAGMVPFTAQLGWIAPVLIAALVLFWVHRKSLLQTKQDWLGAAGLAALGMGYATLTPLAYLLGGVILTFYSAGEIKNNSQIAWAFFLLNFAFSVIALLRVLGWIA